MPRFDLYPAPSGQGYLLDVQTDLLSGLNTRIVVPLLPAAQAPKPATILNPGFQIGGQPHVMVTQFLSAVPASLLKAPAGNLGAEADNITRALDFLYQGF